MKITVRLCGENGSLVETLKNRGISAKLVRGGTIVELPAAENQENPGKSVSYDIPREIPKDALFLIDCAEHGGGLSNTGSGTVVCGLSGKALRPYFVPHSGPLACETHAYFSVPNCVVTITGYRRSTDIKVQEHQIVRRGSIASIETKVLWSGEAAAIEWECDYCHQMFYGSMPNEHSKTNSIKCFGTLIRMKVAIPEALDRFQAAVMAARTKGDCYHCRHVHYGDISPRP